jgi:hypothetical protein
MALAKNVDGDAIRQDRAAGMSQAEIAAKYNVSQSTVSHHVHAKDVANGRVHRRDHAGKFSASTAGGANGRARASNGAGMALDADEVRKLSALANARWESMPIAKRLCLLLAWGVD